MVHNALNNVGIKNIVTREPGGTKLAESLRDIVKYCDYERINVKTELLLFLAARSQHFHNVIKPKLDQGYIVLCDRFIDSTFIYQGYCQHIPMETLVKLNTFIDSKIFPDLTLYIDIPTDIMIKRIMNRNLSNRDKDRFESKGINFLNKVRKGFKEFLIPKYSDRIVEIDGNGDIDFVYQNIRSVIKKQLGISI